MIIAPFDKNMPIQNSNQKTYDEWGNEFCPIISRISLSAINDLGKMDKISIVTDLNTPAYKNIIKESAIGTVIKCNDKAVLNFDTYTYSTNDIYNGDYIQSGGYCEFLDDIGSGGSFISYGNLDDLPAEYVLIDNAFFKKNKIVPYINYLRPTMNLLDAEVRVFEDEYQLPYTETIGLLDAFLTTWTYAYPFETIIIIDSQLKQFNIPKIKYLPIISTEMMKRIYIKFIKEVGLISEYIFRIMEHYKRKIKFRIFFHPFGSIIKIKDLDRHTVESIENYHSTQPHAFMKNIKNKGLKYFSEESFSILKNSELEEPIGQALECSDMLY
jgi:hypothetical protein